MAHWESNDHVTLKGQGHNPQCYGPIPRKQLEILFSNNRVNY